VAPRSTPSAAISSAAISMTGSSSTPCVRLIEVGEAVKALPEGLLGSEPG